MVVYTYTYASGDLPAIKTGSLVDNFLVKYATGGTEGATGNADAKTLVNLKDTSYMAVNYHTLYSKILEQAISDSISSVTITGAITYGGTIDLNDTNHGAFATLTGGPGTLDPAVHANTLWIFNVSSVTSQLSQTITLNGGGAGNSYDVVDNETLILLYDAQDSGNLWKFQQTNTTTNLSSTSLDVVELPSNTTVDIHLTAGTGVKINDTTGAVSDANGSYTLSIDTATLVSPGDFVTTADNTTTNNAINSALGAVFSRLQTITNMIENMNSTFYLGATPQDYVTLMDTDVNNPPSTTSNGILLYPQA